MSSSLKRLCAKTLGRFVEYGNYDRKAGAVCHARSMREGVDDFKEGFAANGGGGRRRLNQFFLAVPFAGAAQAFVQPDFRVIAEVTLGEDQQLAAGRIHVLDTGQVQLDVLALLNHGEQGQLEFGRRARSTARTAPRSTTRRETPTR